jgi:FlaA1/EpsC-like NDP-sugar epimerase
MKSKPNLRNRYMVIIDVILTVIAVLGAYALRLELGALFFFYLPSAYWMIAVAVLTKIPVYYFFGLYRRLWGYASTRELRLILVAVTSASVVVSVLMILLLTFKVFNGFPRSALIIDWLLSLILVGGVRFAIRLISDNISSTSSKMRSQQSKHALVIGAGDAGALVVRELQKNPDLNLIPVGFLDDNPAKLKQQIHGVQVLGTLSDIGKILEHKRLMRSSLPFPVRAARW